MCYIYCPVLNLSKYPQQAIQHLLQALKTVLAWQASCRHIWKKATYFQHRLVKFQLSQFSYCKDVLQSSAFDVPTVLPLLQQWQAPSDKPYTSEDAQAIIYRTLSAKVHAEVVLMHVITTKKVGLTISHVQ